MTNEKNHKTESNKNAVKSRGKMTGKRIAALLCAILLVALYIVALLVAIFDRSSSGRWFFACMIATIFLPILTWIYIWMYGLLTQKHTIASFDVRESSKENAKDEDSQE